MNNSLDQYLIERKELWRELERQGIARVVIEFEGGHDSGNIEGIVCRDENDDVVKELDPWCPPLTYSYQIKDYVVSEPPTPEERLAHTLGDPIWKRYGSFAGEFSVRGTLTWDVAEQTAILEGEEAVERYEDFSELV